MTTPEHGDSDTVLPPTMHEDRSAADRSARGVDYGAAATVIALRTGASARTAFPKDEAGIRLVRTVRIDAVDPDATGVLESDLLWFDLRAEPSPAWQAEIERMARDRGGSPIVIETHDDALIDAVWSLYGASRCTLLHRPSPIERGVALQAARAASVPIAAEGDGGAIDSELARLRDEVGRIAHALSSLTRAEAGRLVGEDYSYAPPQHDARPAGWPFADDGYGVADPGRQYRGEAPRAPDGTPRVGVTSLDIRKMIRMRRLRDKHFPGDLFGDPAWDMLLDLMAARIDRRPVSVSSLCIASAVPATTALRWIKTLTESGLFERRSDPHDGRRVFIALSDDAAKSMHAYFADMLAVGALLPA